MTRSLAFAIAAFTLAFTGNALAIDQTGLQALAPKPAPFTELLDGQYRVSQSATCLLNGERYNKGARMCIGGVFNYCNDKGLWEPSNQKC
ncbi:hypothetical protein [Aliiruegeria sabulilitoris]|uniref:hypothetical protein n=1 Tax=Aliiruegeria sabulilitoris TaxID=1510458 RepID=UPI000831B3D1|nr:hypothetical protein [Aliiruegeria sabulilitoris]NDR56104.1 hypothetical protein [Pseudoruegeria sp. M32A2M]